MTSTNTRTPLVSVAMITYNHRPYLEQAVQSILNQRVDFAIEVLIGEDHSTDGTRELAFELERNNPDLVRIVTSEKNVGATPNMVRVERACRGKYVAYCEGDDFWNDPHKLARQVAFLEANPGYSLNHSHCHRYIVATGQLLQNDLTVPTGLNDSEAFEDMLLGRRSVLTVTVMTLREKLHWVLDHCPEPSDSRWPMGDIQRWFELSKLGKVGCIHEPLATTNVLPESAGQSRNPSKRLKFFLAARNLQLAYLDKYPVASHVRRSVREKLAMTLLWHAFVAGDPTVADEMYSDFVAQHGRSTVRATWLRWGSRSAFRRRLMLPLVKAQGQWQRVERKLFGQTVSMRAVPSAA
jgi:glycosyltransferase involved in cell wall biosynthesis